MSVSKEMPAFPIRPLFNSYDDEIDYERALREAYAARLAIAVEALNQIEEDADMSGRDCNGCWSKAREALALIGPLPPPPEKGA